MKFSWKNQCGHEKHTAGRFSGVLLWGSLLVCALSAYAGQQGLAPKAQEMSAFKRGASRTRQVFPASIKIGNHTTPHLIGPMPGVLADATIAKDENGLIRRIYTQTDMPGAKTPTDAARSYLLANRQVLRLSGNLNELVQVREVESLTRSHVTFQQVYNGLPVFGGRLSVHMDKQRTIELVNADLIPLQATVPIAPPANSAAAIQAAVRAVGAPVTRAPQAQAGVLVQQGKPLAVWRVTFETISPAADWEVMVEAAPGKVLTARNRACYAEGSGMVYEPDPITTSGLASLADNNNADSAILTAQRVSRALHGLDGSGFLTGTYCRTAVASNVSRAFSAALNFNFTRSQNQFDETNCYYHVDSIARYIQSLGFSNIQNRQMVINVNTTTEDNSFYSPNSKQITMGSGGVDDAEDGGVIWHECGHAIQDDQVPDWGNSSESGAMGEGFGDYWAASAFAGKGPNSPGWDVYVAKWDAVTYSPGNPPYLRRVDSLKHYPEDFVDEVHDDGEIWSACLWQLRTLVGKTRADRMILESHFSVSPDGSFLDGANAILAANQSLSAGQDQAAVRDIFIDRGIITTPDAPGNLTAVLSGANVRLNWTDNSSGETGFKVFRQTNGNGVYTEIAQVGANVTSFLDSTASQDTTYTYRVRYYRADGNSSPSNAVTVTTPIRNFAATGKVSGTVGLSAISVRASGTGSARATYSRSPGMNIPDDNTTGITDTVNVSVSGTLRAVYVNVNITHTWRGDLEVSLIAPDGTAILMHNQTGDSAHDLVTSYPDLTLPTQSLSTLVGKQINGNWRLRVRDLANFDTGRLNAWSLHFSYGGAVNQTVTTSADGTYLHTLPSGDYTLIPQTSAFVYAPTNRAITVGPDATGQNFTATVSLSGTLNLEEVTALAQPVTFMFRPTPTGAAFERSVTLNSAGAFAIASIPAGDYTVRVKGSKWLAVARNVALSGGSVANAVFDKLRGGDANNDNTVDVLDLDLLIQAFDKCQGDSGFLSSTDFNCDGCVDVLDLDLLIRNFDATGSE